MHISFSGQHIHSLGESIQNYAEGRLIEVLHKYVHFKDEDKVKSEDKENLLTVDVHFSKNVHGFSCTIIVSKLVSGHILRADGVSEEIDDAFDAALHKLEQPLKKYQSRIKQNHNLKSVEREEQAMNYVINSSYYEVPLEEGGEENPTIIAEKPIAIKSMTVSEAVMRMDLEDVPVMMFRNSNNNRMNVVYYRKDGNISWIDHIS